MSKGAFETLLTQMSQIKLKTNLILATKIESVTSGSRRKNDSCNCRLLHQKGCFMVIATHLGHEIQKFLPVALESTGLKQGLDENNELNCDHNPVLGRLAHSTPELIGRKMARNSNEDYSFTFTMPQISLSSPLRHKQRKSRRIIRLTIISGCSIIHEFLP
jgi:hypothetical protein